MFSLFNLCNIAWPSCELLSYLRAENETEFTYTYQMSDQPMCMPAMVFLVHQTVQCLLIRCCAGTKKNTQHKDITLWTAEANKATVTPLTRHLMLKLIPLVIRQFITVIVYWIQKHSVKNKTLTPTAWVCFVKHKYLVVRLSKVSLHRSYSSLPDRSNYTTATGVSVFTSQITCTFYRT